MRKSDQRGGEKYQILSSKYFSSSSSLTCKRSCQLSSDVPVLAKSAKVSVETSNKKSPCEEDTIEDKLSLQDYSKLSCFSYKKSYQTKSCGHNVEKLEDKTDTVFVSNNGNEADEVQEKVESASNTAIKYTPLEKQYLKFQRKYPDAVLLIECGYKYRFFGKDAEIAKRDLNIGCFRYHNFLSASIPAHRINFHVWRLVLKGHKVGVIKQAECAALKAVGDTRNDLFTRELHAMYTRATFIEEELPGFSVEECVEMETSDAGSGFLMCVNESKVFEGQKLSSSASLAFVAAEISSGDVFYSTFLSKNFFIDFQNCLSSLRPVEILMPSGSLSRNTEKLLESYSCDRPVRLEKLHPKTFDSSFALRSMSTFLSKDHETPDIQESMQLLVSLPPIVVSCLSAMKEYLADFKLDRVLKNVRSFRAYSDSDSMILNPATLRGLEVIETNYQPHHEGSLLWALNSTRTKFGERLLKSWLLKPLNNITKIEERLNIITEIINSESVMFKRISKLLFQLPDLERLLCSAFYHKCSCRDFLKLVMSLSEVRSELVGLSSRIEPEIKAPKIKDALFKVINCLKDVGQFISNIDPGAARNGKLVTLFLDTTNYKSLESCKSKITTIEGKLDSLRHSVCKVLGLPDMKYATVAGQRFLIEVPNGHQSLVPDDWLRISMTKQVSRYQSPEMIELSKELEQEEARMEECALAAWHQFLGAFNKGFHKYKCCISHLAELDCYLSLAVVSKNESYCRPTITDSGNRNFEILQGFHPMISKQFRADKQYVANDFKMDVTSRCLVVSGPNMGGKSTYIRQIGLIAMLSHIGCYVPAESATIPLLDKICVRMGAEDDIVSRKSTFMIEMSESSQILNSATPESLVIFDELGRGTSTNDGAAIAYATLKHLTNEVECFTLFVTHYPPVFGLKDLYPKNIKMVHMSYLLQDVEYEEGIKRVIFFYNVVEGISESSYGINVAALAGISKQILAEAQTKSRNMEMKARIQRQLQNLFKKFQASQLTKMDS